MANLIYYKTGYNLKMTRFFGMLNSVETHRKKYNFIKILFPWLTLSLKKTVTNFKIVRFIENVHLLIIIYNTSIH